MADQYLKNPRPTWGGMGWQNPLPGHLEDVTSQVNLMNDQIAFMRACIEQVLRLPYPHRNPDGVDDGLLAAQLAMKECLAEIDKGYAGEIQLRPVSY